MSLFSTPSTGSVANMCLRLYLHRPNLPLLKILWSPPPDAGPYYAVFDLLCSINNGAALETETHALQDYCVEKDGCVVFYFMKVAAVFRDGDEITVRPLAVQELGLLRAQNSRLLATHQALVPSERRTGSRRKLRSSTLRLLEDDAGYEDDDEEDDGEYIPPADGDSEENTDTEEREDTVEEVKQKKDKERRMKEQRLKSEQNKKERERKKRKEKRVKERVKERRRGEMQKEKEEEDDGEHQPRAGGDSEENTDTEEREDTAEEVKGKKAKERRMKEQRLKSEKNKKERERKKRKELKEKREKERERERRRREMQKKEEEEKKKQKEEEKRQQEEEKRKQKEEDARKELAAQNLNALARFPALSTNGHGDTDDSSSDSSSDSDSDSDSDSTSDSDSDSGSDSGSDSSSEDDSPEERSSKRRKVEANPPPPTTAADSATTAKEQPLSSVTPTSKLRATAPGTLPHQGTELTKRRRNRKKGCRLLQMLKLEGVIDQNCKLAHLTTCLRAGGLDITAPADVLKRHLKEHLPAAIAASASVPKNLAAVPVANSANIGVNRKGKDKVNITSGQKLAEVSGCADTIDGTIGDDPVDVGRVWGDGNGQPHEAEGKDGKKPEETRKKQAPLANSNQPETIKGQQPVQTDEATQASAPSGQTEDGIMIQTNGDPDAWRSKIWLSAYECENENLTLPAPNFPFKQQQLQTNPGKKRKRTNQRTQQNTISIKSSERSDVPMLGHGEEPDQATEQTTAASDIPVEEDLPRLPTDMASLSVLTQPLVCGTVIAFKRLDMDPQTYVPILTDYLTATIEKVHSDVHDGPQLELRLAIRDRPKPRFDKRTGEKILGKFAMPGLEDGSEEGLVHLMWGELLEPKVVKLLEGGAEPMGESVRPQMSLDGAELRQPAMAKEPEVRQDVDHDDMELNYGDDIHSKDSHIPEPTKDDQLLPTQDDDDEDLNEALQDFEREKDNHQLGNADETSAVDASTHETSGENDSLRDPLLDPLCASLPASSAGEAKESHPSVEMPDQGMDPQSRRWGGEHIGEELERLDEADQVMAPEPEKGDATSLAPIALSSPAVEDDFPKLKTEGDIASGRCSRTSTPCPPPPSAGLASSTFIVISDDDDSDPGPPLAELFSQESLFSSSQGTKSPPQQSLSYPSSAPPFASSPQRQLLTEASPAGTRQGSAKKAPRRKSKVSTPPSEGATRRVFRDSVSGPSTGSQQPSHPHRRTHPESDTEQSVSRSIGFPPIPSNWAALRNITSAKRK